MQLISQTALPGAKGPKYPPHYNPQWTVNLADPRTFTAGQPYAEFARLRQEAPVCWHAADLEGAGFWAVTRYADIVAVSRDPETFSSQRGGILITPGTPQNTHPLLLRASLDNMINMDGGWHLQLRREHMPFFTPAWLAELERKVQGEVSRLLDEIAPLGACDLVEGMSSRLPLFTLCELLGVPQADRPKFLMWMHYLELAGNLAAERNKLTGPPPPELRRFIEDFNGYMDEMFAYGRDILHRRRSDPQNDLLSAIARAKVDGELLSDEYLDGSWLIIVFAGNDTTRNTISGTMKLLTEWPEQKRRLIDQPELLPGAVNELTRVISPVIYMRRTATRDVLLNGQMIGEGEKLLMYYGSGNRDESVFADADRLDVTRANADKHLAFGYGRHLCLGKRVAQIQLESVYQQILSRFPDMHYVGGIEIAPNNFVHAIRKLPVAFAPERAAALQEATNAPELSEAPGLSAG